jgi:hypothetical protein
MLVTNPLHEPFHDLRPAIASSHCPLLGDAMGIVSADTFISHDFAAAIAVPPANSKIFLPCNIIVLVFLLPENVLWVYQQKKSPEQHPRLEGSGELRIIENCTTNLNDRYHEKPIT